VSLTRGFGEDGARRTVEPPASANVTPRLAVGLAAVVTTHGTGVEPRVRYWTPPYGVDLYGGYRWDDRRRHVNVGLSVMLWDRFGFFGTHEWA